MTLSSYDLLMLALLVFSLGQAVWHLLTHPCGVLSGLGVLGGIVLYVWWSWAAEVIWP